MRPRRARNAPIGPVAWHDLDWEHEHEEVEFIDGAALDTVELTTVGIDVGSSTSHLMFSRLVLQRLGEYLSSRYVVVERETLHRSPILLTPYCADNTIDASVLDTFFNQAYCDAGLTPADIDSGAIILTGEAIKRDNARAVADLFAEHSGKFVCASAGHNLEAILAANGSGALQRSRHTGQVVLNVDVGGGTSKLAIARDGHVVETAALNVGGRLLAFDDEGRVTRIEAAARWVADALGISLELGMTLSAEHRARIAETLADCLFDAIQHRMSPLTDRLMLTAPLASTDHVDVVTFSGGVSEYLHHGETPAYGDLAIDLAKAIRARMHALPVQVASERIRATVIGASQFTVQVSGNTVAISRPEQLPLHNLQVVYPRIETGNVVDADQLCASIRRSFDRLDLIEGELRAAIALNWSGEPRYAILRSLAEGIVRALPKTIANGLPIVLVFRHDFGRLIGSIIREELVPDADVISIDGIELQEFDYIDIGAMLQPSQVVPVVVKSLVFPESHDKGAIWQPK